MNWHQYLFVGLAYFVLYENALAQNCKTNIHPTAAKTHFKDNLDGSVTDLRTSLRWTRCSLGQQWLNQHCRGKAELYNFSQSIQAAKNYKLSGIGDWRLPTLKELSQIIELSCEQPAINLQVFPGTTNGSYWSSTPFVNTEKQYWLVQLRYGENTSEKSISQALVRLVRSEQK